MKRQSNTATEVPYITNGGYRIFWGEAKRGKPPPSFSYFFFLSRIIFSFPCPPYSLSVRISLSLLLHLLSCFLPFLPSLPQSAPNLAGDLVEHCKPELPDSPEKAPIGLLLASVSVIKFSFGAMLLFGLHFETLATTLAICNSCLLEHFRPNVVKLVDPSKVLC